MAGLGKDNVKLLMQWDIKTDREQDYFEFVVREWVPGITRLGLEPTGAWFTAYSRSKLPVFDSSPALSQSTGGPTLAESVTLIALGTAMFEEAGRLDPTLLRSLDALHLAAALALGDDLEGLVTYDERLAGAAELNGLVVTAPG